MVMNWIMFIVFVSIFVVTAVVTILGLIQKVTIKEDYLKRLFFTLILEVCGVIITFTQTLPIMQEPLADLRSFLPPAFHDVDDKTVIEYLRKVVHRYESNLVCEQYANQLLNDIPKTVPGRSPKEILSAVNQMLEEGQLATQQAEGCQEKLDLCEAGGNNLVTKLVLLSDEIQKFGGTVNFKYDPTSLDKRNIAKLTLEVLGELGYHQYSTNMGPEEAYEQLLRYQRKKNIMPSTGRLGKKTLVQLFNDVINTDE